MIRLRRFALIVSLVFGGSLVLATAGIAAVGGLAPGRYVYTNTSAVAIVDLAKGAPPGKQGIAVYVNRGLNSYRPADHKAPRTVTNSTMVQLSVLDPAGGTFGCFTIPPSDFNVSKNLQSASLHTTLTVDNMCPGVGEPVTGKNAVVPPPGGAGLPLPITLDVNWTGLGVTSTGHDRSSFKCLDYSTQLTSVSHDSVATASGTVSGLSGPFATDLASVDSNDSSIDIKGTPPQGCFGF